MSEEFENEKDKDNQEIEDSNEFDAEAIFKRLLESENKGVTSLGEFTCSSTAGLNQTGTLIQSGPFYYAGDKEGGIHMHSIEHKQSRSFKGVGG